MITAASEVAADVIGAESVPAQLSIAENGLPMRKRKVDEEESQGSKKLNVDVTPDAIALAQESAGAVEAGKDSDVMPLKRAPMSKAREVRLEQNRKAARESRRRKKIMIDELQRSVVFFSRANATLKQQNDELQRMLFAAQAQISAFEKGDSSNLSMSLLHGQHNNGLNNKEALDTQAQQAVASAQAQAAQAAATQAMFQNQGFPPAAARQAAQTFVAGPPPSANMKMEGMDNDSVSNQLHQNTWPAASNPSVANSMQNMQSILFAVQSGIQPHMNMFSPYLNSMQPNQTDGSSNTSPNN